MCLDEGVLWFLGSTNISEEIINKAAFYNKNLYTSVSQTVMRVPQVVLRHFKMVLTGNIMWNRLF